jgi:DNA polymerase-3 subunit delta
MLRLLTGENEFALYEEQKRIRDEFLKKFDAFGLEQLDAEEQDTPRLREAVLQLPFLVSRKLVVINNVFSSKLIQETILELIPGIPKEVDVVLVDTKSDKRTKLYKELQTSKSVVEFTSLKGAALDTWAIKYARGRNSELSLANAHYLIDRVGTNQMVLAREIEKLSVFGTVSEELIAAYTEQALKSTVFDLLDRLFAGKIEQALKLYDELLANKTDPAEILALIGWQLHIFALIKYAGKGAPGEIASQIGVHPFVVGKSMNTVRGLSIEKVKLSVTKALAADIMIKTSSVDSTDVVKVLLLEISDM